MKKLFFIFLLILVGLASYSSDLKITDIEASSKVYGTEYFPLFVGAKWRYEAKGYGTITEINWQIVSAHKIEMPSKNLNIQVAFKLISKELFDQWYLFEYDGFICFFNEFTEQLERKLPILPKLENQWENDTIKYTVVEVKEDIVKIEYVDKNGTKYGYDMYKKGVGPFKKFENITNKDEKRDFLISLIDSNTAGVKVAEVKVSPEIKTEEKVAPPSSVEAVKSDEKKAVEPVKEEVVKIEELPKKVEQSKLDQVTTVEKEPVLDKKINETVEKKESEVTTKKPETSTVSNKVLAESEGKLKEKDIIKELRKNTVYIQVGAYKLEVNAKNSLENCRTLGFDSYVYMDKDGFYKVLIIAKGETKTVLQKVRSNINKDAFIKNVD